MDVLQIKFLLRMKVSRVTGRNRFLVIYNPTAGRSHERRFWKILKMLEAAGVELTLSQTERAGHATELAQQAARDDEITVVVAAGGDGTLGEVAQGLQGSEKPLGLIPLGTANVFACEIGVGTNPRKIVAALTQGQTTKIWPGLIQGRRFLLMIGCGYDSLAVQALDPVQKRKWGAASYLFAAFRIRHQFKNLAVSVRSNDTVYEGSTVVVSRARKYGGPFTVFPRADLRTRDLQVLVLTKKGLWNGLIYGLALAANRLSSLNSVITFSTGEDVTLSSQPNLNCQRDGDLEMVTPVTISLDKTPLNFMMPK